MTRAEQEVSRLIRECLYESFPLLPVARLDVAASLVVDALFVERDAREAVVDLCEDRGTDLSVV